jgi:hypothetical protein
VVEEIREHTILAQLDPVVHEEAVLEEGEEEPDLSGFGIVTFASLMPVVTVWALGFAVGGNDAEPSGSSSLADVTNEGEKNIVIDALIGTSRAVVPLVGFLLAVQLGIVRQPLLNAKVMMQGLVFCFVGMYLFTIGLDGALVPLGSIAGSSLPEAVEKYGDVWGPVVMLAFGFLAGGIATFAEPALLAMGETVEKLTHGAFSKMKLVCAVAAGVACGITMGMAKVYFQLPLWVILLVGYSFCLALTTISSDAIVSIAWDSAGVTTGPVTVPIVLASGLALGDAAKVAEGFGILSCASIGPIAFVLIAGIFTGGGKPAQSGAREITTGGGEVLMASQPKA